MALVGPYAQSCANPDAHAAILRADTPDWAVVVWYSDRYGTPRRERMPYDARLAEALRTALAQPKGTDVFGAPRARWPATPTPLRRKRCSRSTHRSPMPISPTALRTPCAGRAIHACMRLASPRVAARTPATPTAIACSADGAAAPKPPTTTDPAATTLAAELHALGFTRIDPAHPPEGSDAASMLTETGHAYWFDVETGTFPNQHDSLLRSLADLIQPTLAGVVFEEVAPEYDEDANVSDIDGVYLLRAYVDGQLLETQAEDLGDWYDVDAVLRLLDAVLLERKAAERFLLLETTDQTAVIVAADGAVLEAAIRARLLTPGDPDAAEALGKGFEQRVLRSLQQGGDG